MLLLLLGCVRSELPATQSLDCQGGDRVVVDYAAYCVISLGEVCPEAVPFTYQIADRVVCAAEDEVPEAALLAAAREAAGFETDGGEATDARPATFVTFDAGAFDE